MTIYVYVHVECEGSHRWGKRGVSQQVGGPSSADEPDCRRGEAFVKMAVTKSISSPPSAIVFGKTQF